MKPVLQLENLIFQKSGHRIVSDLSFSVFQGEIFALLGPNGAGKSSTFRIIAGLESDYKGTLSFMGKRLIGPLWKRVRIGLGYLPQKSVAFWQLSVWHNIWVAVNRRRGERQEVDELIDIVGLQSQASVLAKNLSGGECRRMELARCLALQPKLLLLDEPFAGLDPISISQISEILVELKQRNISIVFTDHAVGAVLGLCDRALVIDKGQTLGLGDPVSITKIPIIKKRYLGSDFVL